MNIKVCGVTTFKQLQQLDGLEIDMAGLVLIPDTPWYAGDSLNANEVSNADFDLKKVGILRNPSLSDALDCIDAFKLDAIQLIGEESPELCEDLGTEVEVIKLLSIEKNHSNLEKQLQQYDAVCDYYLFTGPFASNNAIYGGAFDWNLLTSLRIEKPFFLSGGIGLQQSSVLRKFDHLDFFGADLNLEFETAPGEKDFKSILQFRQLIR